MDDSKENEASPEKSEAAKREEEILAFWDREKIFEKSLEKDSPSGEFVFYEGPPTANGRPGIHHLEARAFKDIIPRYKTMRGFHVRRKGGWDTHGLPVELEVEKQLGITSKKQIEEYGIAAFNKKCKESVWKYVDEWQRFTNRIAYWVDTKDPYVTYDPKYIESLWNIVGKINDRGLLYRDYKVVPWCPRCGTALSSHELAQGYKDVKDLSVYVKFRIKNPEKLGLNGEIHLLAWTTTPWTLPGNVALAVGKGIEYLLMTVTQSDASNIKSGDTYVLAKDLSQNIFTGIDQKNGNVNIEGQGNFSFDSKFLKGEDLIGLEYEPLYDFLPELASDQKEQLERAYKVYAADFVSTEEGTGIVHTAVMYGQDDFELGTKVGLPKHHLVDETGHFVKGTDFLEGAFVKDEGTEVAIIKDLAARNLLFRKERHEHNYPFCWRCKTPLIYYARDSWYVRMSELRDDLIKENQKIHWEPEHIREGRFGEWLSGVKDWAISRERYWGTPLPVWESKDRKERLVIDSLNTLKKFTKKSGNKYFVMRHGEAEHNAKNIVSSSLNDAHHLTSRGKEEVAESSQKLKNKKINLIIASPLTRTKETAEMVRDTLGLPKEALIFDEKISEVDFGEFDGKKVEDYGGYFSSYEERFTKTPPQGINYHDYKIRIAKFLYDTESKYRNKNILFVTHDGAAWFMESAARGATDKESLVIRGLAADYLNTAEVKEINFVPIPHNEDYELDLHRPYIDQIEVVSEKGTQLKRTIEVMDVWFDSGAMPFAQDHYPFENKTWVEGKGYPADYISEAIDQTRGWFYTLHAVGVLMGRGRAYKNVICLGHLLDKEGKKMSKSIGNVVNPWEMIEKYGTDVLRFWMFSINQPGDSKNFDEKTVQEVANKVFNLLGNVFKFYQLYSGNLREKPNPRESKSVLDQWILALLDELNATVSRNLDSYNVLDASRSIRDFIADFSQWYIRRSRERFKNGEEEDELYALATTRHVLVGLSKIMAPFSPLFSEDLFQKLREEKAEKSVHLENWPEGKKNSWISKFFKTTNPDILPLMNEVRAICSFGLDARQKAGIKVRQPLQTLFVKSTILSGKEEYISLIKDEVNVKEVVFESSLQDEVRLVTEITEGLKMEGLLREVARFIQDLRKKENLSPGDKIEVSLSANPLFNEKIFDQKAMSSINASKISFQNQGEGEKLSIGEAEIFIKISRV